MSTQLRGGSSPHVRVHQGPSRSRSPGTEPYLIDGIYALRNRSGEAFEWLNRAYAERDDRLIATKVDPLLHSLHNTRDLTRS
jgi:hypothetical protein